MKHKRKIVNRFLSTLKNFFPSYKNTIKKVRRQASDWKKIFTIYISDKGLLSRICDELI